MTTTTITTARPINRANTVDFRQHPILAIKAWWAAIQRTKTFIIVSGICKIIFILLKYSLIFLGCIAVVCLFLTGIGAIIGIALGKAYFDN